MKPLKDCRYSAFISYSHAANNAHGQWVSQFQDELFGTLKARLRAPPGEVPPMHLSGTNGPFAGLLGHELERNIADSFAMIIVVDESYNASEWCLKELEYFKRNFGSRGFEERLYVVAMSQPAMTALSSKPEWTRLVPPDLVWIPFFRDDQPHRPVRVYLDKRDALTERFEDQLDRILQRLVESIKKPPPPLMEHRPPKRERPERLLFGVPAPEFAEATHALADAVRKAGVAVTELTPQALQGDFAEFDGGCPLVLPFGRGGSALPGFKFTPGGHLAVQRDAWIDKGCAPEDLWWLDLRDLPIEAPAAKGHAELVAEASQRALTSAALLALCEDPGGTPPPPAVDRVNIYIESNQNEVDVWEDLGDRIKARWSAMLKSYEPGSAPPLQLHPRGLPLQKIDSQRLDDADGVVLLWGNKTDQSLWAQIDKVERKLVADPPPGIVAYLIPHRDDPKQMIEANLWNVLRFQDSKSHDIDIMPPEAARLDRFLRKILDRTAKRRRPAAASAPGA